MVLVRKWTKLLDETSKSVSTISLFNKFGIAQLGFLHKKLKKNKD